MQIDFHRHNDEFYVKLSDEGCAHLTRHYSDFRRKRSFGHGHTRDVDSHRAYDVKGVQTEFWKFTLNDLLTIFVGANPSEILASDKFHIVHPPNIPE